MTDKKIMNDKSAYNQPVINLARKDFTSLNKNLTVEEALNKIRSEGLGERIVYFYVVDDDEKIAGVLPTRRLLLGKIDQRLEELMVKRVAALPATATVYDALEFFATYKFLAFPVIDAERKILGIVDVNLFTDELLEDKDKGAEENETQNYDAVFETIGFRINELKNASPIRAWKIRFPWLLVTISSGTIAAVFTGIFHATIEQSLIIAFFLALVLGLGESVSIQSMTVAVQALHTVKPTAKWYLKNLFREIKTALLLGIACGVIVAVVVELWKRDFIHALMIGVSIVLVELSAVFWGLSVPTLLHKTKLDPKISAGPITLALTDICTILFYFGLATVIL
jgi:magnesium transporter